MLKDGVVRILFKIFLVEDKSFIDFENEECCGIRFILIYFFLKREMFFRWKICEFIGGGGGRGRFIYCLWGMGISII